MVQIKTAQVDIELRLAILKKQFCYFNQPCDDEFYKVFISKGNFSNGIYFKINRIQGKDETFDAEKTSTEDGAHNRFSKLDSFKATPVLWRK